MVSYTNSNKEYRPSYISAINIETVMEDYIIIIRQIIQIICFVCNNII